MNKNILALLTLFAVGGGALFLFRQSSASSNNNSGLSPLPTSSGGGGGMGISLPFAATSLVDGSLDTPLPNDDTIDSLLDYDDPKIGSSAPTIQTQGEPIKVAVSAPPRLITSGGSSFNRTGVRLQLR